MSVRVLRGAVWRQSASKWLMAINRFCGPLQPGALKSLQNVLWLPRNRQLGRFVRNKRVCMPVKPGFRPGGGADNIQDARTSPFHRKVRGTFMPFSGVQRGASEGIHGKNQICKKIQD
ncbi:MAG TPA: hypothetical protein ENK41_04130 [Rhodobacteraceae bacterium]|nr:hypothetical protein [Paracoccaceae bacterium]